MTIKTTWILVAAGLMACGGSSQPATTTTPAQPTADSAAAPTASATAPADTASTTPAEPAADNTPTEWKQAGWSDDQPAPAEQPAAADDEGARRCREVVPHILDIFRASMDATVAGMSPEEQARVREQMEKELNQESVIAECLKRPLTPAQYDCAMAASTMDQLMKCEKAE